MLKFAFALGICFEWLTGPAVESAVGFGLAAMRTAMAALAAWMILEAVRALVRAIEALDDRA